MGFSCKEYKFRKKADLVMETISGSGVYLAESNSQFDLAKRLKLSQEELRQIISFLVLHKCLEIHLTYMVCPQWQEVKRRGGFTQMYINELSPWTFITIFLSLIIALASLIV